MQYTLVLVHVPNSARYAVAFKSERLTLRLQDGSAVKPAGLAPGLDADFRSRIGERIPSLIPTASIQVEQQNANAYGILFCVPLDAEPKELRFYGRVIENLRRVEVPVHPPDEAKPADPIRVLSNGTARGDIPFSYREGTMQGFSLFQAPGQQEGILAVGPRRGHSIVVVRVPRGRLPSIDCESIRVHLRDGDVRAAKGIVLSISLPNIPPNTPALVDKVTISERSTTLNAGGTAHYWHDYLGPLTSVDELDWKVAIAFDAEADWQSVRRVELGDYVAEFADGTLVIEAK